MAQEQSIEAQSSEPPVAQPFVYPGAFPPPVFLYQPQPDADGNNPPVQQFMMLPQAMYYAVPPGQAISPIQTAAPSEAPRPKRKQVKTACTNCAEACKRCDDGRPCQRCIKLNLAGTCRDGQRKERKRGIKRGPYKRKNKPSEGAEWSAPQSAPAPALIPVISQLSPEGFPVYSPSTLIPVTEGQPPPDGSIPMPYFYPPYAYPGLVAPPPPHGVQLDSPPSGLTGSKKSTTQSKGENEGGESDS